MPLSRFVLLTTLAIIPWSVLFLYLGMQLGNNWKQIEQLAAPYTDDAAIAAGVLLLLYFLFQWYRKKQRSRNGFSTR
jgi:membrane protein DedA with SNARE-associated domain